MSARILVVDDDPWILRMVTASLRKRQFTVDTARDGRQALDRIRAHAPAIIITDVMMPVMDGWTLVKQLRQDARLAAIPVIFLTALSKDASKLRSLGLTEKDYLSKPFRFEDLEKRVDAALGQRSKGPPPPPAPAGPGSYGQGPNPNSGVHPMPGPNPNSGVHPLPGYPSHGPPPGPNPNSGVHPLPGYPSHGPPPGPNPNSGVHPMPGPYYPPQGGYPGQYPPQQGQYPPQYPPHPGQYPPQQGQYPPQYPPHPGQYPPQPGQYPPQQGQYPGQYPPQPGQYPGGPPLPPQQTGTPPPPPPPAEDPRKDRPRRGTALNGKLEQLGLSSLLVMMEMERKQGVLSLMHPTSNVVGRVFLRGGRVVAAELEDEPELPGKDCVYQMLGWQSGTFSFNATTVDVEDSVQSSTTHLLMEGARLIDEAERDTL